MPKFFLLALGVIGALAAMALGQTPLSKELQITLPQEFEHTPLRGIDSIVGKIVKKKGALEITYDIGRITPPGGLALGGDFVNQAERSDPKERAWLKQQTVRGQPVSVAYSKQNTLIVSFPRLGVNFAAQAKTPEDVVEVLLITLSAEERRDKK